MTLPTVKATGVTDTGLSPETQYSYAVFTRDTTDNTTPTGVTITTRTLAVPDVTAPGPVTDLAVTARGETFVHLSWTNPTDTDLAEVTVRRAQGATPPATPTAGQPVTLGSPTATSLEDTGLSKTTRYSYAVFTRDTTGNTTTNPVTLTTRTRDNNDSVCAQPLTEDATWSPDYRDVYLINCTYLVPTGITLTIETGTIVKLTGSGGVQVASGGALIATGTTPSPVMFTSLRDDSADGDMNNDAAATSPAAGDWGGIYVDDRGGALLDGAVIRYAADGVTVNSEQVTVKNSVFEHLTGSALRVVRGSADPDAWWVNNTATDCGSVNGVEVTTNLTISSDAAPRGRDHWQLVVDFSLLVPDGVTLTLPAGSTTRFRQWNGGNSGVYVQTGGTLTTTGTTDQPATLTSGRTSPAAGDWGGIYVDAGAVGDLDGVAIRYAATAVTASSGGSVALHGSVATSSFGVAGSDTYLDATNVDWGDPSGPAPIGTGVGYSGSGVLVAHWVGWVQPTPAATPPYSPPSSHVCKQIAFIGARGSGEGAQTDFDDPFENPPGGLEDSAIRDAIGSRVARVLTGFTDEYVAKGSYGARSQFKVLGVPYRALGTVYDPLRMFWDADYASSIYDGVNKTVQVLYDEHSNCPNEKFVLSGYSQGALVIHIALRQLNRSDPGMLDSIAGVALVSDPAKTSNPAEKTLEAYDPDFFNDWAGTGVTKAQGLWTQYWASDDVGPLPGAVTGDTIAMCRNHDIVCAPRLRPLPGQPRTRSTTPRYTPTVTTRRTPMSSAAG